MSRANRRGVVFMAAGMLASGCYGPFHLTRHLHQWNEQVGDKYENELAFLVCTVIPIYQISVMVDLALLNPVAFWTGKHPLTWSGVFERMQTTSPIHAQDRQQNQRSSHQEKT